METKWWFLFLALVVILIVEAVYVDKFIKERDYVTYLKEMSQKEIDVLTGMQA